MSPLLETLKFVVMSGSMTAYQNKKGIWKKKFGFRPNWEQLQKSDIKPNEKALAIVCGKQSGCSVIDIDDPTTEQNMQLMDLMFDCNMIQETKNGFHYVWNYNDKLRNTQGDKLDIRTDGGCIFTEPSVAFNDQGEIVASYKWIKTPLNDQLMDLPIEVIEYLVKIGGNRYVKDVETKIEAEEVEVLIEPTETKILLQVINQLPIRYLDSYSDWIAIGMVLYNEGYTVEDWDLVSKRSTKYEKGNCIQHWNTFKNIQQPITGATLWKWLKQSNPIQFYTLMEERQDFWNLIALLNHKDGAKYFYNIHPDSYLWNESLGWFALGKSNIWKQYDNGQPNGMKRHLADTLQELAMDTKKAELVKYTKISSSEKDKKKQEELTKLHVERIKAIHSAYTKLGSSEFCNGVLAFLPSFYNDDLLEDKMDKNSRLFSFTNGTVDLDSMKFRTLLPTDYVSITCGYDYCSESNPIIKKELEVFLYGLFENNDSVYYLTSIIASCLFGGNRWQEFYCMTGTGGNGKGLIAILMKMLFGNYYLSVDSSLLTKSVEKKDQPIPALVEARTCRLMLSSEPEATDKLQAGLLKKISGGDQIEARTLHSKKIWKYVAMFKLFILANDIPALSKIDGGLQRRMKVLKFPFAFKKESECTTEFHRIADPDLERKVSSIEWRNEMILMLLETYEKIRNLKSGPSCPSVEQESSEYMNENNPLKHWLEEHYNLGGSDGVFPRELKSEYVSDTGDNTIDDRRFAQLLKFNGIIKKKSNGSIRYIGLVRKGISP